MVSLLADVRWVAERMASEPAAFRVHLVAAPPATPEEIQAAEKSIGASLPADLVELYTLGCAGLSFTWRIHEGQEYRLGVGERECPGGQVELLAPGELERGWGTDYVVVFGDGSGGGVALDLGSDADPEAPWVVFDHDSRSADGGYRDLAEVVEEMRAQAFGATWVTPATDEVMKFLAGGALRKARKEHVPKAPRPAARKRRAAVPPLLQLAPHKWTVGVIAAIDERRVVTGSSHEKLLVVRDVQSARPLGKLKGAGLATCLVVDAAGRLVSTGRGRLERFDLESGACEVLSPTDPYAVWAEMQADGSLLELSTAYLARIELAPNLPRRNLAEIDGSKFWRWDDTHVLVVGRTAQRMLRMAFVDVDAGKMVAEAESPITCRWDPACTTHGGAFLVAFGDGTLARAVPPRLTLERLPSDSWVGGPGLRLPDGKTWIVAQSGARGEQPRIDVFDLEAGERRASWAYPSPGEVISVLASAGGRIVIGDSHGRVVSLDAAMVISGTPPEVWDSAAREEA